MRWIEEQRCLNALDGKGWKDAAAMLGRLGCLRAVPRLFALLPRDPYADFKEDAAGRALLSIGWPAFQLALAKVRQGNEEERQSAWRLLQCLPHGLVPMLVAAADDPTVQVRITVARLLLDFPGDPDAEAAHIRLLADGNPDVRLAAVESIGYAEAPEDHLAPMLVAILKNPTESALLREAAGSVLHYLPRRVAVPAFLDGLLSPDPLVRIVAARELGKLREKGREGIPRLEELLRDPDDEVRLAALSALLEIGPTSACLQPAIKLLDSNREQSTAARVISRLGPAAASAVPALIAALQETPPGARTYVIHALGCIGPAAIAAVPLLHRELADESSNDHVWAAQALGRLGPAALVGGELLVELGLRDEPEGCREGLVLLGASAVPALIRVLESQDAELREKAADFLGSLGLAASQAVPALTAALADHYPDLAERAAWALGRIGPAAKSAVPALVALLGRILEGRIGCDLEVIAEAFGRIGVKDDPVPGLLRRLARSEDDTFHSQALLALGRLGVKDDETVKLLLQGVVLDETPVPYFSAHALLHLGIREKAVDAALDPALDMEVMQDFRFDQLKLHAGFPEEMKRILPQCVRWLGEAGADAIILLAQRLAEVGPGARSTLAALQQARIRMREEQQYWAENPIDSGGSHHRRGDAAEALEAIEAAIESVSKGSTSTSREGAPPVTPSGGAVEVGGSR